MIIDFNFETDLYSNNCFWTLIRSQLNWINNKNNYIFRSQTFNSVLSLEFGLIFFNNSLISHRFWIIDWKFKRGISSLPTVPLNYWSYDLIDFLCDISLSFGLYLNFMQKIIETFLKTFDIFRNMFDLKQFSKQFNRFCVLSVWFVETFLFLISFFWKIDIKVI